MWGVFWPTAAIQSAAGERQWQVAISTVIHEAASHPPGRGLQEERLGAEFFNFDCFKANTLVFEAQA